MSRLKERTKDRDKRISPLAIRAQLKAIRAFGNQTPHDLGAIRQPVLVANGDQDVMVASSHSVDMARRLPHSQLRVYPDSGHGGGPARPTSFVRVRDGAFQLGGAPFRFGGTNCYYLHQQSHYMIDAVLDDAANMSLKVLRAWAFADGVGNGFPPLQPQPYQYDEAAFDSLDYAVYKAGQVGVRLVLALTNNWPDYGGMRQYVTWFLGLPDAKLLSAHAKAMAGQ